MINKLKLNVSSTIQKLKLLSPLKLTLVIAAALAVTSTAAGATYLSVRDTTPDSDTAGTTQVDTNNNDITDKKTEETAANTPTPVETPKPAPATAAAPAPSKATVKFTKGGGSLQGSTVVIALTANATLNGTCTYTLTLGNSTITQSNSAKNTTVCAINIPVSTFPKSGNWFFSLTYKSVDGNTSGIGGGFDITIVPEVREINFTKGGAGLNGAVVSASGNLSENQSGICTYTFSLNGTVRVSKTTTISNSNRCAIDIPIGDFPKSAIYSYNLSFISNDTLTVANQGAFDVEVF